MTRPTHTCARWKAAEHGGSIEVPLDQFEYRGAVFDTSLRLDAIPLDLQSLLPHVGRSYRFPVNPVDGFIDGSIYLDDEHVPFDTSSLVFGAMSSAGLPLRIEGALHPGYGFPEPRVLELAFDVLLLPPPTALDLEAMAATAVARAGAKSLRDHGRVMAELRQEPRAENHMRELAALARRLLE